MYHVLSSSEFSLKNHEFLYIKASLTKNRYKTLKETTLNFSNRKKIIWTKHGLVKNSVVIAESWKC